MSKFKISCLSEIENACDNVLTTHNEMSAEQFAEYIQVIIEKWHNKEAENIPEVGEIWRHKKNKIDYVVSLVVNQKSSRNDYPVSIVYRNIITNDFWCKPLDNFLDRMERITWNSTT